MIPEKHLDLFLLPRTFRNYYVACRNKDGFIKGLESTSRWRALKFAVKHTWWWVSHPWVKYD